MKINFQKLKFNAIAFVFFVFLTSSLPAYQYQLSLCAIFKDEAPYLKEWIDFHRLVGVQHFWLYNNLSTDCYKEVLQPYIEQNIVELIDWPYEHKDLSEWNSIQCNAYNDALKRSKKITRWLMVIDTDEFFFSVADNNLIDFLNKNRKQVCICANWQMFGTGHVEKIEPGEYLIEKLILKGPDNYLSNFGGKCICKPKYVKKFDSPHYPLLKAGVYVDADGCHFLRRPDMRMPSVKLDKIRINHYWMRDEHFMWNNKFPRRKNWQRPEDYQGAINSMLIINEEISQYEDKAIYKFLDKLKEFK